MWWDSHIEDLEVIDGKGCKLKLSDGKWYHDLGAGATSVNLGHGRKELLERFKYITFFSSYFYPNKFSSEYRKKLIGRINGYLKEEFYGEGDIVFVSAGNEAVDVAVRIAKKVTGRKKIVSTYTSYHGRSLSATSLTKLPFSNGIADRSNTLFFKYPKDEKEVSSSISELEEHLKSKEAAACILEPFQGEGGITPAPKGFLEKVRELCDRYGVLLIFDEIQSGFGRCGHLFYFLRLKVRPDIFCIGKGMANGVPASGVICKKGLLEDRKKFSHELFATSFGGNPFSMVAALWVLEELSDEFLKEVRKKSSYFIEKLKELLSFSCVKDVRGIDGGIVFGVELRNRELAERAVKLSLSEGLLFPPPKGAEGTVLKISPPLIITYEEIDDIMEKVKRVLTKLEERGGG